MKHSKKKGQVSFEYITVYGWMLIITVIMIGILVYFDVFNFQKYSAQYCRFDTNFLCNDFTIQQVDEGVFNVIMLMQNNMNKEIQIQKLSLRDENDQTISCIAAQINCPWYEMIPAVEAKPASFTGQVVRYTNISNQWNPTRVCLFGLLNCTHNGAVIGAKQTVKFEMEFSANENSSNHTTTGIIYANIVALSSGISIPMANCSLIDYNEASGEFKIQVATDELFKVDSGGVIQVKSLEENSGSSPGANDFIIQNETGSPVAWVSNPSGRLHLLKTVHEEESPNPTGNAEFRIQDNSGTDVAMIDRHGDLYMSGCLKETG